MSGSPALDQMFARMPQRNKRILAVAVIAGGVVVGRRVQCMVLDAQAKQRKLSADINNQQQRTPRKAPKVAVNKVFFKRLTVILSICVPSVLSREAWLILVQTVLLVSRTLLTEWIARIEGLSGSALVSQNFPEFMRWLVAFGVVGLPAAVVNSGLKYMQKKIELAFQQRLTKYLHNEYCSNRSYYAASNLGGMTSADQRITEDLEKFCFQISDLYAHTFKPVLDVILFTRSLAQTMGYKTQFLLYGYYILVAYILRTISPPLAQMASQEAALTGAFRSAHQRLVTYSEEVAYNDPPGGSAEKLILNQHLRRLVQYSGLSAFQRFIQQIADGYLVKYFASVTALLVYAAPLYYTPVAKRASQGDITRNYISSMRLLQNTSRGIGDIILIYKRITNLASHTSRVSELLEQVHALSAEDSEHRELFRRNVSSTGLLAISASGNIRTPSSSRGDGAPTSSSSDEAAGAEAFAEPLPPTRVPGEYIRFHRVALDAPDGSPLVRELTFEVPIGEWAMLMGQNGSGKSSLFRVMAGLWPLQAGEVMYPDKRRMFYLSQRPYLVSGTLRDQILYPYPPRMVWEAAPASERACFASAAGRDPPKKVTPELDEELEACLRAVELEYLLKRGRAWDQVQNWTETLSGGEKQRLAMARLLYHRPTYAILDECTSAVSADGEVKLYEELQRAGITCLSIAHRPTLKRFHSTILHFDGNVTKNGRGWWLEHLDKGQQGDEVQEAQDGVAAGPNGAAQS